jgi:probable phosphoglycerate mutase
VTFTLPEGVTLFFCRHGETEANAQGLFQGRNDTPLTERGRQQAREMALILRDFLPKDGPVRFVSSPLGRARATMEILRETLGLPVKDYETDPRLMEIDLGRWSGLTKKQSEDQDPALWAAREKDKGHVPAPGGENYMMVAARVESFVAEIKGDTVVVGHGACGRILRGLYTGLTWQQMSDLDEQQGVVFRFSHGVIARLEPEHKADQP